MKETNGTAFAPSGLVPLFDLPGDAGIAVRCTQPSGAQTVLSNPGTEHLLFWLDEGEPNPVSGTISTDTTAVKESALSTGPDRETWRGTYTAGSFTVIVFTDTVDFTPTTRLCSWSAQLIAGA